ncbi:MAG: DUF5723 family protein [bacterium]
MHLIFFAIIQSYNWWVIRGLPENYEGFGKAYIHSISKNDIQSVSWNPANYYLNPKNGTSLELFSVQTNFVNEQLLGKTGYNYYIDDEAKDKFFASIKGDYYTYKNISEKTVISVAYKNYAFTYKSRVYWDLKTPKDFYTLLLIGGPFPDTNYNLDGGKGTAQIVDEYGLNISLPPIKGIFSGVRLKYLQGKSCSALDSSNGLIETTWDSIINTSEFFFSSAEGGNGFGIDFGIAGKWKKFYTGLCIENLYSIINWTDSTLHEDQLDTTLIYEVPSFKSHLPVSLRMASSYDLGVTRFIFATSFEKYWAFSVAASSELWKHILATGGFVYSFSSISPIIQIGFSPTKKIKLMIGYHTEEGPGPLVPNFKSSAYSFSSSITF